MKFDREQYDRIAPFMVEWLEGLEPPLLLRGVAIHLLGGETPRAGTCQVSREDAGYRWMSMLVTPTRLLYVVVSTTDPEGGNPSVVEATAVAGSEVCSFDIATGTAVRDRTGDIEYRFTYRFALRGGRTFVLPESDSHPRGTDARREFEALGAAVRDLAVRRP